MAIEPIIRAKPRGTANGTTTTARGLPYANPGNALPDKVTEL